MEQREKIHLKKFTERLREALRIKTGWGRNQLYKLIDEELISYLIDEGDLEMEEKGAIEALGGLQAEEEVVSHRSRENGLGPEDEESLPSLPSPPWEPSVP